MRSGKAVEAPFCISEDVFALIDIGYNEAIGASVMAIAVHADGLALTRAILSAGALACVYHEACCGVVVHVCCYNGHGRGYISTASCVDFFDESF